MNRHGIIAHNLIQELKKDYRLTVITRKNDYSLERESLVEGVRVVRIVDHNLCLHRYLSAKINKAGNYYEKKWYSFLLSIKRIAFYFPRLLRRQSFSIMFRNKIQTEVNRLNLDHKIDALIPVSAPHEEVFAGVEIKKNFRGECKLLVYQLDRYANANSLYENSFVRKIKHPNNLRLEVEALSVCDGLFILPALQKHYHNKVFEKYHDKIVVTEHPLVKGVDVSSYEKKESGGAVNVLYAGSLDQKLRNPSYLFEMLQKDIFSDKKITVSLYSFGNCRKIIDSYKPELERVLFDFGRVSSEEIARNMFEADVLLTIGNNSANEVPSKLFECLSFCKPIIHLYYSEKDAYLEYLKSYPYALCLQMDRSHIEQNAKLFYNFCIRHRDVKIDFESIRKNYIFCTPGYVAKQFVALI